MYLSYEPGVKPATYSRYVPVVFFVVQTIVYYIVLNHFYPRNKKGNILWLVVMQILFLAGIVLVWAILWTLTPPKT